MRIWGCQWAHTRIDSLYYVLRLRMFGTLGGAISLRRSPRLTEKFFNFSVDRSTFMFFFFGRLTSIFESLMIWSLIFVWRQRHALSNELSVYQVTWSWGGYRPKTLHARRTPILSANALLHSPFGFLSVTPKHHRSRRFPASFFRYRVNIVSRFRVHRVPSHTRPLVDFFFLFSFFYRTAATTSCFTERKHGHGKNRTSFESGVVVFGRRNNDDHYLFCQRSVAPDTCTSVVLLFRHKT